MVIHSENHKSSRCNYKPHRAIYNLLENPVRHTLNELMSNAILITYVYLHCTTNLRNLQPTIRDNKVKR